VQGIDLKTDEIWGLDLSMTGRATALSLSDITMKERWWVNRKVVAIFDLRNVGHKKHARPRPTSLVIKCKKSIGGRVKLVER
jgi:hypothetical protein